MNFPICFIKHYCTVKKKITKIIVFLIARYTMGSGKMARGWVMVFEYLMKLILCLLSVAACVYVHIAHASSIFVGFFFGIVIFYF